MATALRPIGHEEKLSLVDHLDELRKRLIICVVIVLASFALCFSFNDTILDIVTKPVRETQNLQDPRANTKDPLEQNARFSKVSGRAFRTAVPALHNAGDSLRSLSVADNLSPAQQTSLRSTADSLDRASAGFAAAARATPTNNARNLVTLGVAEPFTSTMTISLYAALLLAAPFLLYQLYAFILPAFSPTERKIAMPIMLMVPTLFVAGVAFGYFVVLDRAVHFLQNFNDDSYDILLQAQGYFKFVVLFVAGIGLLFQIPVAVLAVTRTGIIKPKQLAKQRGYVILGISILAAVATPTPDPVTMSLAMGPLIILFELSILVARWLERVAPARARFAFGDEDDEPELVTSHPED